MKTFMLPIGSDRRLVTVANPGFRTGRQLAAVRRLTLAGRVAFACGDPFRVDRLDCKPGRPRSFWFTYVDPADHVRAVRLSPTGRVTREMRP
jgi:hypothetical protein